MERRDRLLPAVRRLSSAWRAGATSEEVLAALARELHEIVGVREVLVHTLGEGAEVGSRRIGLDGDPSGPRPEPGPAAPSVPEVFDDGNPRTKGDAAFLPLYADSTVLHVVELRSRQATFDPGAVELALTLVTPASAALAVLDAQAVARVDPLTGLLNRSALVGRLEEEMAQAGRTGMPLSVLYLDLDGFKAVNDLHGHLAGDELLRRTAEALAAETRPYDHLARIGGDEFVVVLPLLEEEGARAVAGRIRAAIRAAGDGLGDAPATAVSASAGMARWRDREPVASLLDRADEALRRSKARGRDQTSGETGRMRRFARSAGATAGGRDGAQEGASVGALLDSGRGLRACFQPIVDLGTETVVAYEALTRGPAGSPLERPDHMLAAARAEDRLVELDTALRLVALNDAAQSGLRAPCTLFVNCEPETASRLGELTELWTRNDAPFESVVEITERTLTERPAELLSAINELRAGGWGIALDDVGADERALALLPFLRPDVVKLDLRLVQEAPNGHAARVFAAVQAYAEESGAAVLAEGIETERHLAMALAFGANLGQGFFFGRPDALPERIPPARVRLPHLPPPHAARDGSPFSLIRSQRRPRRAPQGLLDSIAHQLERQAVSLGPTATVIARLHPDDPFMCRRIERLGTIAERVGFVAAVGPDLPARVATGVRGGAMAAGDGPAEWALAVVDGHACAALVAREAADGAEPAAEHERQFDFVLTHDRALVMGVARALMAHVAPDVELGLR